MIDFTNSLLKVWRVLDGWAGHKCTNSWTGEGESEGKVLTRHLSGEPASLWRQDAAVLEDVGDASGASVAWGPPTPDLLHDLRHSEMDNFALILASRS